MDSTLRIKTFKDSTTSETSNILLFVVLCASLFFPAVSSAATSRDIILFFDSSNSIHQYRPDIVPDQWLRTFIGKLPDETNLVIVNFDDGIQNSTTLNAQQYNSGKTTIPAIPLNGLVSDMAAPLQYLVDYQGHIILAAIISDGEPEIWDDVQWYLARTALKNSAYDQLNQQYGLLTAQGLSGKELYEQMSSRYIEKNHEIIQSHLAILKKKIGQSLIFVDLYGKFPFLKEWAETGGGQYVAATNPDQSVSLEKYVPFFETSKEENIMAEPAPLEPGIQLPSQTTAQHALPHTPPQQPQAIPPQFHIPPQQPQTILPHPQTTPQQPQEIPSQPHTQPQQLQESPPSPVAEIIGVTEGNQPNPPVQMEVYKADPSSILIAILLTAAAFFIIFSRREKTKLQELLADIGSRENLLQELTTLSATLTTTKQSLAETQEKKDLIEAEIQAAEQQLETDRTASAKELEAFEHDHKAKIEEKYRLHAEAQHADLEQELAQIREKMLTELDYEAAEIQKENQETVTTWLQNETKALELEMQEKKATLLSGLTELEQKEKQTRKDTLQAELAVLEQQSQATIRQWEDDAGQRSLALLDTKYREKVIAYQNDIRQLDTTYNFLRDSVYSIQTQKDQLEIEINEQRQLLDNLIATQVETLVEERQKKEELLWQKVSVEIQQAKEEAIRRLHTR